MPELLTIVHWEHPSLTRIAEPVAESEFGPQLETFAENLVATMRTAQGIGLAAPQVDVSKRIFAMCFPDHKEAPPLVVVNPELVLSGETLLEEEGCLSLPGLYQQVARSGHANLRYRQPDGKTVELLLDLWDARVAQHEFDHLNGIMFFDRMSRQMRKALLRRWESRRGKTA